MCIECEKDTENKNENKNENKIIHNNKETNENKTDRKIRKVFLDNLPRWGKEGKSNEGKINWVASVGCKVKFSYNDINGEIEIVGYDGKYLRIQYLNKNSFKVTRNTILYCKLGKILNKITKDFKINIGKTFKDEKRDITVIDRKYIKNKNGYNIKYYKYRCNKCGFECGEHYDIKNQKYKNEFWINESNLLQGKGCPCCCHSPQIVVLGINDISTIAPWMIKYFQGGYEEAKLYSPQSSQKIYPICPDCGRVKSKSISIANIYNGHSMGCSYCGDGVSYPNKLCFILLEQLNINFKTEYSPEWVKPKRFDFYFEQNNKKYIVEMDGGWHKINNNMSGQTKEESQYIDCEKDRLAKEHNIEVIRIDSSISELEYIKRNILNSKLNKLFDLYKVDWEKCEEFALSNLVKKVCEIKRNKPNINTFKIGKMLHLGKSTIINYLKKGSKLGWCYYDTQEEMKKSGLRSGKLKGKQVKIFKNNNLIGIFPSCAELERQSEEKFGVKLDDANISAFCLGKYSCKTYKGFTFKFLDDYNYTNKTCIIP